jgi:hypothetical protein
VKDARSRFIRRRVLHESILYYLYILNCPKILLLGSFEQIVKDGSIQRKNRMNLAASRKFSTRHPRFIQSIPFLLISLFFLWSSFYGLDFGVQWDEPRAKFDSIKDSLQTGLLFQASVPTPNGSAYNYGGVNYLLTWSGLAPEVMHFLLHPPYTLEHLSQRINPVLYSLNVRLRVRAIYVLLAALTIAWIYWLNCMLGRRRSEAVIAAAILASSWEVAYHSRYVAPDAIMMQFVWLAFACLAAGQFLKHKYAWFYAGAAAIGLAMGTKYPGALVLPVFLAGVVYLMWRNRQSLWHCVLHSCGLFTTAGLTFVLTNPGVALDPFRFSKQLNEQHQIYSTGWFGYTVRTGGPHFEKMLKYFSLQVFSHYSGLSIILALFCLIGIGCFLYERKLLPILISVFSLIYLLFFSQQAALIVRNLLVVIPFLALAAARGTFFIADHLGRASKHILCAGLGIILMVNFGWEAYAARTIKIRHHQEYFIDKFVDYVRQSPDDIFFVSARLHRLLDSRHSKLPGNIVTDPHAAYTQAAFLQTEGPDAKPNWPNNKWNLYKKIFGPLEVNLLAYTTFIGNERIIVMARDKMRLLPMTEAEFAGLSPGK